MARFVIYSVATAFCALVFARFGIRDTDGPTNDDAADAYLGNKAMGAEVANAFQDKMSFDDAATEEDAGQDQEIAAIRARLALLEERKTVRAHRSKDIMDVGGRGRGSLHETKLIQELAEDANDVKEQLRKSSRLVSKLLAHQGELKKQLQTNRNIVSSLLQLPECDQAYRALNFGDLGAYCSDPRGCQCDTNIAAPVCQSGCKAAPETCLVCCRRSGVVQGDDNVEFFAEDNEKCVANPNPVPLANLLPPMNDVIDLVRN